jgi:hypothetical protein
MRRGGFDAVMGNPPFIGGQRLTGAIGKDVREYLVEHLSRGKRGSADLCSYFLLRNLDISWRGRVGIIATNTIAQGDTREVGLDQAISNGVSVYRAVKSQPWPRHSVPRGVPAVGRPCAARRTAHPRRSARFGDHAVTRPPVPRLGQPTPADCQRRPVFHWFVRPRSRLHHDA